MRRRRSKQGRRSGRNATEAGRAFADGGDRLDPRCADGRAQTRQQRDPGADGEADDDRPDGEDDAFAGKVDPGGLQERAEPDRDPQPEEEPDDRADDSDDDGLEHDRPEHLPAGGAERAQGGELAEALRNGDRERVRDHEAADEESHPAEAEQEVLDEVQPLLGGARVRARLLGGGLDLGRLGEQRADLASSSGVATPSSALTRIRSSLPALPNRLCAVGRSKTVIVAPPSESTLP